MGGLNVGLMEPASRWESHWHPMGLMYISSYLARHDCAHHLINNVALEMDPATPPDRIEAALLDEIGARALDVIGLGCAVNEVNAVRVFAGKAKARYPRLRVMVGGPMPTAAPELFLEDGRIDYVVRGEGEATTLDLLRALATGGEPGDLPGLSRRLNGGIIHHAARPPIDDLDAIPFPAYDRVDMARYAGMHAWVIRGFPVRGLFVLTSRGCPFPCTFCGAATVHGRKVRYRSAASIRAELEYLKARHGVEGVFFSDDTFTLNRRHVLEVAAVMKDLGMVWSAFARVDTLDEELLVVMKESGCLQLDFGVESGSDRILAEIIRKGTTVAQTREAFRLCRKHGVRTFANLMIGLPTETEQEMRATATLADTLRAHAYVVSIAMPLPGTTLWEMVAPRIGPEEFDCLNWHGEDRRLTDRCNRSEVDSDRLIRLHDLFVRRLRRRALLTRLANYSGYLADFVRLGHLFARLRCEIFFHLQGSETLSRIYRALKARFRCVGAMKRILAGEAAR